eukprot:SAG11_NODE_36732_length_260_cov_0.639752_2_plen_38_part_01
MNDLYFYRTHSIHPFKGSAVRPNLAVSYEYALLPRVPT